VAKSGAFRILMLSLPKTLIMAIRPGDSVAHLVQSIRNLCRTPKMKAAGLDVEKRRSCKNPAVKLRAWGRTLSE
jgi:hypothetical protein